MAENIWWTTPKLLFKWAIPGLFFFLFVFSIQLTVNNVQCKICWWLDSNPRLVVSEATTLPISHTTAQAMPKHLHIFSYCSDRDLCSEAVPLLEKCLTEDPTHERALLLLTDCLLERSGGSARSRNRTPLRSRKNSQMATEIKTILENGARGDVLSKNEQMNGYFSQATTAKSATMTTTAQSATAATLVTSDASDRQPDENEK